MLRASATFSGRSLLRTAAVTTSALAMLSVSGAALAAPTAPFGSPYGARSHGKFGAPASGGSYNGTQAVAQLTAIATATRSASAGGALITGSDFSDNTTSNLTVKVDGTSATQVQIGGLANLT